MFGFTLKKWFYDFWDNALMLILMNFIFLTIGLIGFAIPWMFPMPPTWGFGFYALSILGASFFISGIAGALKGTSDFEKFKSYEIIPQAVKHWPATLFMVGIHAFAGLALWLGTIYYGIRIQQLWGYLALGVIYWLGITWFIMSSFFLAYRIRTGTGLIKTLKELFRFFLDNPVFCIGTFFVGIFLLAFSTVAAFIVPGPAGVLLWYDGALKLRLRKNEYLEYHPEMKGKKIPWNEILAEDKARLGQRKFKNFFQPWK